MDTRLNVHHRFQNFITHWREAQFFERSLLVYGIGWLISFIILILGTEQNPQLLIFLIFSQFYFLFKFINEIRTRLQPPVEIFLFIFAIFILLDTTLIQSLQSGGTGSPPGPFSPAGFFTALHVLTLALLLITFGLILVHNSKGRKYVLIWYFFLGLIGKDMLSGTVQTEYLLFFYQIFILVMLLQKTKWLEELTRTECWIYFGIAILFFDYLAALKPFQDFEAATFSQQILWYKLPHFLFILFKLYFLAIVIKIPLVIVYNHSRLSRKLWIAGLFQSTFPQIIQLCMLCLIFHFFVAGWQAENVRQTLLAKIDDIRSGETSLDFIEAISLPVDETITLRGYQPFVLHEKLPEHGIMLMSRRLPSRFEDTPGRDNFLFVKHEDVAVDSVYLIKLNWQFMDLLTRDTQVLAGNELLGYPYTPGGWEKYLYTPSLLSEDSGIRIFPYAITPQITSEMIKTPFKNRYVKDEESDFSESARFSLILGRVLIPLFDHNSSKRGHFVFDVLLIPTTSFFLSPIVMNVLYLLGLYFILNLLVIRRVIKFGSEINKMIVQKFESLKKGIWQISTGNLDYKVKLEGQDEFVELGERFNAMGDKLKETIAEAREKDRLEHELDIARQVQLSLLPTHLPDVLGFQVAATLKTATEVGGDFYDIAPLGDNRFLFTIGDVSGKSTSAAFYMAQCISLIRFSPQFTSDPKEITLRLNKYFADPLVDKQMFVTAIIGLLDANTNTIQYVRAGHTLPIFVPGDPSQKIRELESPGLGIGIERTGKMLSRLLQLDVIPMGGEDTVIFYTDGLVEASKTSPATQNTPEIVHFFGEERLLSLLEKNRNKNAMELLQLITNELESFYQGKPPGDDYTLLIIQKSKESGDA